MLHTYTGRGVLTRLACQCRIVGLTRFSVSLIGVAASTTALGQCYSQELLPPTVDYDGRFGTAMVASDRHVLIGEFRARIPCGVGPTETCNSGKVTAWAFDVALGQWVVVQEVHPVVPTPLQGFGNSLALDGNRLIVGAFGASEVGGRTGAAYVLDVADERWTQTGVITPPMPVFSGGFGSLVAIEGSWAVVRQSFRLFVFEEVDGQWQERETIVAPDRDIGGGETFGTSIALVDGWLFVGAYRDRLLGNLVGSVYVFRREGDGFEFVQKIYPPDPQTLPEFGIAVASDGRTLLVGGSGAERTFTRQGAVYEYLWSGSKWEFVGDFVHDDPRASDGFGSKLALEGDRVVVGMVSRSGPTTSGWASAFERNEHGTWGRMSDLRPLVGPTGAYGSSVALRDRWMFVAAPSQRTTGIETGAVHVFDVMREHCNCPVDLDGDGETTVFDFLEFLNLFQAGDLRADFDGDGRLTVIDFLVFQSDFVRGC